MLVMIVYISIHLLNIPPSNRESYRNHFSDALFYNKDRNSKILEIHNYLSD